MTNGSDEIDNTARKQAEEALLKAGALMVFADATEPDNPISPWRWPSLVRGQPSHRSVTADLASSTRPIN